MYLDLNEKQLAVLEFIKKQLIAKGYPPSVREICAATNVKSTSTVHGYLNKLEELGYIRRDPTKPRAIEILDDSKGYNTSGLNQEVLNLPLVGQITAGEPILAQENIEEYIPLPANLIQGHENFLLKVKGESMINAGILDDDYLIVEKKNLAFNSQIVIALINGEVSTVKRFFREGNYVRLQPENDFMDPIRVEAKNVEILGVVTGVFRAMV